MGKYDAYCRFVFVCGGSDCKKHGSKEVQKAVAKELKAQGLRGKVKVIKTKCTGRCKEGPVVIAKENWMTHVKPSQAAEIIEELKL
jgi:NADH:ubiquinone oxidoreductase subunit E